MRIALQPAYVLHARPYRDSSSILELFTAEHGRLSVVGKGSRRSRRGAVPLQPFTPLLVSYTGRAEMKTLTQAEIAGAAIGLAGERLFSGLYLNELLVRLLHRHDPHPALFAAYGDTLQALSGDAPVEGVLRRFEFRLLDDLGYRFDPAIDGHSGESVREQAWYHYHPDMGMVEQQGPADPGRPAFAGADLLRIARGEFGGELRLPSRRLARQALATHLGSAPLRSRELFRAHRGEEDSQ